MSDVYVPKHPRLFRYDPAFLDPKLLAGHPREAVTEVVEQLYMFRLFTPEFCELLLEEAEHCGKWRTEADVEDNPYADGVLEECEPDTTQHLHHMTGLDTVFAEIVQRHLRPLMESLWVTFKLKKAMAPYILKYEYSQIRGMKLHHDLETVTLVGYLNGAFEGGGTYFPRWKYSTGKQPPGTCIMYPGGLSHEHEGLPITSGTRYLLCSSFY